jgi:hypothetical protein
MTRLCILLSALAVIARTRVALLPGWVVPLPVLLTAALLAAAVAAVAWTLAARPRDARFPLADVPAAEPGSEVTGS